MVIVLVTARYQKILNWIFHCQQNTLTHIGIIKQNGPKIYLYIKTDLSVHEVIHFFQDIIKQNGGVNYVYQFYTLYNGMIDYNHYLTDETKETMKYYQSQQKDMTLEDIQSYERSPFKV